MLVSDIIYKVRAAIDEVQSLDNPRLTENVNFDNLDMVIADKIPYALEFVIQNAPTSLLDGDMSSTISSGLVTIVSGGVMEVTLPSDTLRVVSARLSSWYVAPPISDEHSDIARMQAYPVTRGSVDNPAAILYAEGGKQILRMYSVGSASDEYYITVIRKPTITMTESVDGAGEVNIPQRVEACFIYYLAGLTALAMGESSQPYFDIALSNLKVKS